jgi:hypothetical protein
MIRICSARANIGLSPTLLRSVVSYYIKCELSVHRSIHNQLPHNMTTFTLNTGAKIPAVGFGTWKAAPGDAAAAVEAAFDAGYRHFVR